MKYDEKDQQLLQLSTAEQTEVEHHDYVCITKTKKYLYFASFEIQDFRLVEGLCVYASIK